jgi:hypothetical protein
VRLDLRYLGKSEAVVASLGTLLRFAPNLARPKVFFDAEVRHPLRYREAMSALHAVVVGDLRRPKRDRSAYLTWRATEERRMALLIQRRAAAARAEVRSRAKEPLAPGVLKEHRALSQVFNAARSRLLWSLAETDPKLFRWLVPCDPVVTVAPDVVFFECFSKDESSYGCLSVDRDAFLDERGAGLGTTNVDYSLELFHHFQTLRSYRPTRLVVDPTGFEVAVAGREAYREEKIDLPPSWLRGFGQLQAAMALPAERVFLSREAVYSLLAFLKRHREKTGPRSLAFRLTPGRPPAVLVEPFGLVVESHGPAYDGPAPREIKVWGRRRLLALARALPLAERFEVRLLGSGLPSVWTAHMGEMRLTLALSGWTANDWSSGASLDLLFGDDEPPAGLLEEVGAYLARAHSAPLSTLEREVSAPRPALLAALHLLAKRGQAIYDFAAERYRYRQVMPEALSEEVLGPEPPERAAGRQLFAKGKFAPAVRRRQDGRRELSATISGASCKAVLDPDGAFQGAECSCGYFMQNRLRAGPCRHLLALRLAAGRVEAPS